MNKHGHHHHTKSPIFRRFKKHIVVTLAFLVFFALSNYYMGFFSFGKEMNAPPVIIDTPPKTPNSNADTNIQVEGPTHRDKVIVPIDDGTRPGRGALDDEDDMKEEPENDPPATCKHTRNRDYAADPIVISGRFTGNAECDVPCTGDFGTADAVVGYRQTQCPHIKSIFFTMENSIPPAGSYDIVANTQLTSDVPVPYFSWAEYNFRNPVQKKTASAHVAAFISNCGPQKRLQWMEVMMRHGVKIDSYGNCMRNKQVPGDLTARFGSNYNALKVDLVGRYKFTMAFENSETDDYVTEKLFGVFVAGSVPLYNGASNGKKFGPSAKSMIFADDYGSPEKLAEYLLYLDQNDTAYEEYLSWKKYGPSDSWVALVDLANVHSNCRLCIHTADLHRKEIGAVKKGNPEGESKPKGKSLELHVRERGKFWMRSIYLTSKTLEQLKDKINTYVPHVGEAYIFSIYDLWTREAIETDSAVSNLKPKTELEIIFVVSQNWEPLGLMP